MALPTSMSELTPEMITEIMANSRSRGEYLRTVQNLPDDWSGLALDLTEPGPFKGKVAQSVATSLKAAFDKDGRYQAKVTVGSDTVVYLIRQDA